ncbi:MAG: hypothetical protein HYU02_08575 [Thaumarchaeota archaeon]|nr:hypothetical protein [Nitrososphaerota archaeon]
MKAIKKLRNRKIVGSLAAIAWMAMLLIYVPYVAEASPCNLSLTTISGDVVRPPQITDPIGTWSFSITGSTPMQERNGIVLGTLEGTFSATQPSASGSVTGTWSYNQQTGSLLIMLSGSGFRADISILNLPSPGFTFSGSLLVNGQQPAMLVKTGTETISCN